MHNFLLLLLYSTGAYLERVQQVPRTRGFSEIDKSYLKMNFGMIITRIPVRRRGSFAFRGII